MPGVAHIETSRIKRESHLVLLITTYTHKSQKTHPRNSCGQWHRCSVVTTKKITSWQLKLNIQSLWNHITPLPRPVKLVAHGPDTAHTHQTHPSSVKAKNIPMRHDTAYDVIRFYILTLDQCLTKNNIRHIYTFCIKGRVQIIMRTSDFYPQSALQIYHSRYLIDGSKFLT